jgi:hypothetical protein
LEVRVQSLGLGVYNLEFMVSGFRVRGLGFRMEYLQLRVTGGGLCVAGGARLWDALCEHSAGPRSCTPWPVRRHGTGPAGRDAHGVTGLGAQGAHRGSGVQF